MILKNGIGATREYRVGATHPITEFKACRHAGQDLWYGQRSVHPLRKTSREANPTPETGKAARGLIRPVNSPAYPPMIESIKLGGRCSKQNTIRTAGGPDDWLALWPWACWRRQTVARTDCVRIFSRPERFGSSAIKRSTTTPTRLTTWAPRLSGVVHANIHGPWPRRRTTSWSPKPVDGNGVEHARLPPHAAKLRRFSPSLVPGDSRRA